MNIYITAHRSTYMNYYNDLIGRARSAFPQAHIKVVVAEPAPTEAVPDHFIFLLPSGFENALNGQIDEEATFERLQSFIATMPLDICRSDIRHVVRLRSEAMLALEQAVICEALDRIFEQETPDLVFVSSGTNILHSIAYHLAMARGAKTYRVHSYLNLNLNLEGQRVWFCANNKMAISECPEDRFNYDEEAVSQRIATLHQAMTKRLFKLDVISKTFRKRRMPVTFSQFFRDIGRMLFLMSPLQRRGPLGRLSANANRDRLRVLVNGWRNRKLSLSTEQLPRRYILFALNTPYDSQILVRAPEFRDLLSLIEQVAALTPYGYDLVVREHPAFLGMLDHSRLKALQKRHAHVKLVSCDAPFPDVVAGARGVLIINNTAFVDAILAEKPVISLANGYFRGQALTREVSNPLDIRVAFSDLISGRLDGDRRGHLTAVMSRLFQETFPGPLDRYDDKQLMISDGILAKLQRIQDVCGSLDAFSEKRRLDRVSL